mgnify:CR=1 FL=1
MSSGRRDLPPLSVDMPAALVVAMTRACAGSCLPIPARSVDVAGAPGPPGGFGPTSLRPPPSKRTGLVRAYSPAPDLRSYPRPTLSREPTEGPSRGTVQRAWTDPHRRSDAGREAVTNLPSPGSPRGFLRTEARSRRHAAGWRRPKAARFIVWNVRDRRTTRHGSATARRQVPTALRRRVRAGLQRSHASLVINHQMCASKKFSAPRPGEVARRRWFPRPRCSARRWCRRAAPPGAS